MSPGRVHKLGHYVAGEVHNAVGHFVVGTKCLLTDENSSRDCEKITNLQDQTLGVHFELMLSTYMLSIDFPRRRFSSTPNEDDEDDFNKSPPAPIAPQPINLYSTLALDINQHHNL